MLSRARLPVIPYRRASRSSCWIACAITIERACSASLSWRALESPLLARGLPRRPRPPRCASTCACLRALHVGPGSGCRLVDERAWPVDHAYRLLLRRSARTGSVGPRASARSAGLLPPRQPSRPEQPPEVGREHEIGQLLAHQDHHGVLAELLVVSLGRLEAVEPSTTSVSRAGARVEAERQRPPASASTSTAARTRSGRRAPHDDRYEDPRGRSPVAGGYRKRRAARQLRAQGAAGDCGTCGYSRVRRRKVWRRLADPGRRTARLPVKTSWSIRSRSSAGSSPATPGRAPARRRCAVQWRSSKTRSVCAISLM